MRRVRAKKQRSGFSFVVPIAALMFASSGLGCSGESDAFNLVSRLRILAIQSEPPFLQAGETAVLSSLVFESEGKGEALYEWSWCPFSTGRATGYECAISEDELREMMETYAPGSSGALPPFYLGSGEGASFAYTLPPQLLETLCDAALQIELPSFIETPTCDDVLNIVVKLQVRQGDEQVTAIKQVGLKIADDFQGNNNPTIGALTAIEETQPGGSSMEILADGAAEFERGREFKLEIQVSESQSESYVPQATDSDAEPESVRETLFVSWYITGGETDFSRTSYIDGEIELDELRTNFWRTPLASDCEDQTVQIFLVLQDDRGGVGWIERSVRLAE